MPHILKEFAQNAKSFVDNHPRAVRIPLKLSTITE